MFKPSTPSVAKPIADALLANRRILGVKSPTYPVGVVANHYFAPVAPTYKDIWGDELVALKNQFVAFNEQHTAFASDEYDQLVDLMAQGITRMLTTVRGVIIPYCKEIDSDFVNCVQSDSIPSIQVDVFNYSPIHAQQGLVEHVLNGYANVQARESYRTFRLEFPGIEKVVEWVSTNPHVPATITAEWAISLGEDTIRSVWWELFERDRTVAVDSTSNFGKSKLPANLNAVLLAYFLSIALNNNPQDVVGESVSLQEWQSAFGNLHQFFGALLAVAYDRRLKDVQLKRVVFSSDVYSSIAGDIKVVVNGDIWTAWLEGGGNVKHVLGAAVSAPNVRYAADLATAGDDLIRTWDRKHYIFKQTKIDQFNANRRRLLVNLLASNFSSSELRKDMPNLEDGEIRARVETLTNAMSDAQLDDRLRTIKDLVCEVFYPNTPYREFLNIMDRTAQDLVELSPREVSLIAVVELTAQWLAKQIESTPYTPDLRESPVQESPSVAVGADVSVTSDAPVIEQVPVTEEAANVTTEPAQIVSVAVDTPPVVVDAEPAAAA